MPASTGPQTSSLRLLILSPTDPPEEGERPDVETVRTDASNARFTSFLTGLTGTTPSKDLTSFAGYTSHPPLNISTKYHAASVNLWCDELPSLSTSGIKTSEAGLSEWTSQMLSSEAQEVREVIGSIIILSSFNAANTKQQKDSQDIMSYIAAVNRLRETIEDESGRDVATIVAVQDVTPSAAAERQSVQGRDGDVTSFAQKLEESCLDEHGIFGWDIAAWKAEKSPIEDERGSQGTAAKHQTHTRPGADQSLQDTNEFGEKLGMARVLEVLEQVNWSTSSSTLEEDDENDYDPLATDDFLNSDDDFSMPGFKPAIRTSGARFKDPISEQSDEFQREIMGLHFALEEQKDQDAHDNDEHQNDIQVEKLSSLMERVVAIKEAGSEMSKADRENFARREVGKIMREMDFGE